MLEKRTVNIIAVFDKNRKKLLVCKRRKNPYKGLLNLVGGKVELQEDGLAAAYRELEEETGITETDIRLFPVMDFLYHLDGLTLEVYAGYLNRDICVHGEENELLWIEREQNFFDETVFAGKGNLGHIMALIETYEKTGVIG